MDNAQRELFRAALLDNIKQRGVKDVVQFIETLPEEYCKEVLFPYASTNTKHGESQTIFFLHEACELGKFEVFTAFVNYSHTYGVDFTVKNAEGYTVLDVATLKGRMKFAEYLVNRVGVKNLLLDAEFRRLVSLACQAGNEPMVEYWLSKMTEYLNRPLNAEDFVSGIDPVTEAVKGNNLAMACDLFKRNFVKITESMFMQTGSFLIERLDELIEEVFTEDEQQILRAQWHGKNIWYFDPSWLKSGKVLSSSLHYLDLSSNHLDKVPAEMIWGLPQVQYLYLNQNELEVVPVIPQDGQIKSSALMELNLSNNKLQEVPVDIFRFPKLKSLNLSHNYIQRLPYDISTDGPQVYAERCQMLETLNVSNNQLGTLPLWITKSALALSSLNIANNGMENLLPSWKCPLRELNASSNNISEMSVCDLHTHWAHSLERLNLSKNDLQEIPSTVCRLTLLNTLDLSRNEIRQLPPDNLWTTRHMKSLNLSNNRLLCNYGNEETQRRSLTFKSESSAPAFYADLVFPKVMCNSLQSLYLGSNQLQNVPESVCEMHHLGLLDLSGNKELFKLPYAMCRLRNLFALRLDNTPIREPTDIVHLVREPSELLQKLRETAEDFKPFRQVKVVVAGPKGAGKTTLIRSLWGTEAPDDGLDTGNAIDIVERRFKPKFQGLLQRSLSIGNEQDIERDIDFNVWDLKGGNSLEMIYRCCLTPKAIYMLVMDLNGDESELDKLMPWWLTIKSVASGSQVIIVGTHMNNAARRRKAKQIKEFQETLKETAKHKFAKDTPILFVDIETSKSQPQKIGFTKLQEELIKCVNKMNYFCRGSKYQFSKLMVPQTFLTLKERITTEANCMRKNTDMPRILTESNIQLLASELPDLSSEKDLQEVLEFLNCIGTFIHISDRKFGIGRLYFPDPSWLCDVIKSVTSLQQKDLQNPGKITKEHLKRLCQSTGFGKEKFKEFEQLLLSFEIIMPSTEDNNTYWIPCKLPAEKPAMELYPNRHQGIEPKLLRRIYRLPYVPPGFWIRLVSRIITCVEHKRRHRRLLKPRSRTYSGSGNVERAVSISGSIGQGDGTNVYWQTGILVFHETGDLLVEDLADSYTTSFRNEEEIQGVCIAVKCQLGRFSIMGMVVDEVENLISNWYPDLAYSEMHRLIPCPICEDQLNYRDRSDSSRRSSDSTRIVRAHLFSVEELGTKVCKTADESVPCPNHEDQRVLLEYVVPEMFLDDLDVTILLPEKLEFFKPKKKFKLGSGGFGDVYKGAYNGEVVAIKSFAKGAKHHASSIPSSIENKATSEPLKTESKINSDKKRSETMVKKSSKMSTFTRRFTIIGDKLKGGGVDSSAQVTHTAAPSQDQDSGHCSLSSSGTYDPEVIASFSKLRNELSVMCRLRHPYIVSLIGASLEDLCFAMEFAPFGDLNTFLQEKYDSYMTKLTLGKHTHLQGTMVARQLSFKIAYQIAAGLIYLHEKDITHADLKPANVLVFSKDVNERTNVKITDYGISRNIDHSGNKGRVGTQGFRAPEIGHGLLFDKEVDWFSFGRLLYQLFTGVSPSHHFQRDSQIKEIDEEAEKSRFPFVRYTLHTSFPLFIALMRSCWRENPPERPRDSRVKATMEDCSILALRHVVQLGSFECICPVIAASTVDDNIHVWTGGVLRERRRYQVISSDQGKQYAESQLNMGMPVQCAVKVGKYNVIGTANNELQGFQCTDSGILESVTSARTFKVPATAVALHYQESVFEETRYLFAGLKNGTTIVYQVQPHEAIEKWTLLTTFQLGDPTMPCNCFHPVRNGKEVWVACGNTLRIINTVEMKGAPGIIDVGGKDRKVDVACLTGTQNSIWCSLQDSDCVLEYSTQRREQVNKINVESNGDGGTITSLLVVKDTLWIGKNNGEITVVSISEVELNMNGSQHNVTALGVLSLHQMLNKPKGCISQILKTGKNRITACYKYQKDDQSGGKDVFGYLAVWECWGSEDFKRFQSLKG